MKPNLWTAALMTASALACASAHAGASDSPKDPTTVVVTDNPGGMPRCLFRASDNKVIKLVWTRDVYRRNLYAKQVQRYYFDNTAGRRPLQHDRYSEECLHGYREFLSKEPESKDIYPANKNSGTIMLRATTSDIFGLTMSDTMMSNLRLAARGMNWVLPDGVVTGADYLARNPIPEFTRELNVDLTSKYGAGFAGEIFKSYLEWMPHNADLKTKMMASVDAESRVRVHDLKPMLDKRVFVLVQGLSHDAKSSERFDVLPKSLRSQGANVIVAQTSGLGDMEPNATSVRNLLLDLIGKGQKITILTLSKGAVEAAWALTDIADRLEHPKPGDGTVDSVLSFSPVYGPSFVIQKMTNPIEWLVAKGQLEDMYKNEGNDLGGFVGLFQLRESYMQPMRKKFLEHLPRSVVYVNIVGVVPGYGLSNDEYDRSVQDGVIRPNMTYGFGANDTYLEYPYNTLDRKSLPNDYEIVMQGTHGLIAATFEGYSMQVDDDRDVLLHSLVKSTLDLVNDLHK